MQKASDGLEPNSATLARKLPLFLLLTFGLAAAASPALAAPAPGQWGVGVNYPGLGLRYVVGPQDAIEAKAQAEGKVRVYGGRYYRYLKANAEPVVPFVGFELDYVTFEGAITKGTGYATELFVGGEFFFAQNLSFQMDAGPAYISLTDDKSDFNLGGVQYVVNFGINFYFGGK